MDETILVSDVLQVSHMRHDRSEHSRGALDLSTDVLPEDIAVMQSQSAKTKLVQE